MFSDGQLIDGCTIVDLSQYYGFDVKQFQKIQSDIGIAFFTSATPPNMIAGTQNPLMSLIGRVQNWHHDTDTCYIHCALVIQHPKDKKEYVYHFNRRGALREDGKDFRKNWAWQRFNTIAMEHDDFLACVDWMDSIYNRKLDSMEPNYDAVWLPNFVSSWTGYDLFPMAFLYICCDYRYIRPFQCLCSPCLDGREDKFNCSSFVCKALQIANVQEVKDFNHKTTTSHNIFEALFDRPIATGRVISSLKSMEYY